MSKTLSLILVLGLFSACQQEELSALHETIYIRHEGADMPAYIRGNPREKVFIFTALGEVRFQRATCLGR